MFVQVQPTSERRKAFKCCSAGSAARQQWQQQHHQVTYSTFPLLPSLHLPVAMQSVTVLPLGTLDLNKAEGDRRQASLVLCVLLSGLFGKLKLRIHTNSASLLPSESSIHSSWKIFLLPRKDFGPGPKKDQQGSVESFGKIIAVRVCKSGE